MNKRGFHFDCLKTLYKLNKIRLTHKNHMIFIALSGIGDICYCFSFLNELKKLKNKKVLVLTRKYTAEAVKCFAEVDEIKVLTDEEVTAFNLLFAYDKYQTCFNQKSFKNNIFFCFPLTEKIYEMSIIENNETYNEILKRTVVPNNENTNITYPSVSDVSLEKFGFGNLNNTVIINPYSNSLDFDNTDIFEEISALLIKSGYDVYTNVVGEQSPVSGTKSLSCTLDEMYHITKQAKLFISIRSGILDFSISNGGNFLILYDDTVWNGGFRTVYSLKGWNTESKVYEFDYREKAAILKTVNNLCQPNI